SVRNGLSRTSDTALRVLLERGPMDPRDLFNTVNQREARPFMGDTTFFVYLRILAGSAHPAIAFTSNVVATPLAQQLVAGQADWIALNGIDHWRGGVHLHAKHLWRWDERRRRIE